MYFNLLYSKYFQLKIKLDNFLNTYNLFKLYNFIHDYLNISILKNLIIISKI